MKNSKHRHFMHLAGLAFLGLVIIVISACSNPMSDLSSSVASESAKVLAVSLGPQIIAEPLIAGKSINAGDFSFRRDKDYLYFEYKTNASYLIAETHLWVGTSLSAVPQNKQAIVVPGQFPYSASYSPAVNVATVKVPISWQDGASLYVFAHAALIGANSSIVGQTAFAGTGVYDSKRWTYYLKFDLPSIEVPKRTIDGTVFFDANNNGLRDSGEAGIGGAVVSLSDGQSAASAADGSYSFKDLPAKAYVVGCAEPSGLYRTTPASLSADVSSANASGVDFGFVSRKLGGVVYFDANGNAQMDADEPVLPGVSVTLSNGATATSGADGGFLIERLPPVSMTATAGELTGLSHSSPATITVDLTKADALDVDFGYGLDLAWIESQPANGFTIGYWKNNIDKAISGSTKGVQVTASTLQAYVAQLSSFALAPLNPPDLATASAILSSASSDPLLLLSKQLMASEFNYVNGAYFGGAQLATYLFIYQGEYMLQHSAEYGAAEILSAKDLYDAYNNTHGGSMVAPAL